MDYFSKLCFRQPPCEWTPEEFRDELIYVPRPNITWRLFLNVFKKLYRSVKKKPSIFDSPQNEKALEPELSWHAQLADLGELSGEEQAHLHQKMEFHLSGYIPVMLHNRFTRHQRVVVYFHGNSEDIGTCFAFCSQLNQLLGVA